MVKKRAIAILVTNVQSNTSKLVTSKYPLDVRFYPLSSHFPTRHPFSRQFPDRFEDSPPPPTHTHTFEDSSTYLSIFIVSLNGK